MLKLNEMVSSTVKVSNYSCLLLHPGGTYNMDVACPEEQMVAKLHLLQHFCQLAVEDISCNGENKIVYGEEIEHLADKIYDLYKKFITNGINIFEYNDYYQSATLAKYHNRPIVGRHMNIGPDEQPGVPAGWSYEFPGQMEKYFEIGKVIIDKEADMYRVGVYNEEEQPIDWFELKTIGDLDDVYLKYPNIGPEVVDVIRYIKNNEQI